MRKIIEATEGHILTNGEVFGRTIYLAEGEDGNDYYEIPESELESLEEAKEEDYRIALTRMGVNI